MDWKTKVDAGTLVKFTQSAGRVYADFDRPLTITSPPFVTAFPKLSREEVVKSQERGIRITNYEVDINMTGATEAQENFKAFMESLDEHLLAFVTITGAMGASMGPQTYEYMQKRLFKTRRSNRTAREYPEGMNCRSKFSIESGDRFPVVDNDNNPYTEEIKPDDIIRVQLTYKGPYVIRSSCFGNSWELTAVQYCGHYEAPPPCFHPPDPSEFPTLPKWNSSTTGSA